MRRMLLLLLLCLVPVLALGEVVSLSDTLEVLPQRTYDWKGSKLVRSYQTETLKYTIETTSVSDCKLYVTKLWMQDPGRQIKKATATWEENLLLPEDMAAMVEGCALAINGSGYVSPTFPEIPDNYPGTSENYYYTPLGSLTITDGEIFRNLAGVPFYGLTLEYDGLHLNVGEDNEAVLARNPTQTWSFYVGCPMIRDHESILDRTWTFANRHAARTVIAQVDRNNYILITATSSVGISVCDVTDFLMKAFDPEWAYDLDGGPSSALIARNVGKKTLKVIYGGKSKDADIMAFVELEE